MEATGYKVWKVQLRNLLWWLFLLHTLSISLVFSQEPSQFSFGESPSPIFSVHIACMRTVVPNLGGGL